MKYAYDCSGGRHRLLWTSDHLYRDTIYGYGADGLQWSVCDGEYRFYHYDYRGSVVAVTDIDGNVTDTVKYDAYGSTVERTGESSLIFGYNGQYGVLTDPNGLLYMRTRFYNPQLKRFMKADILEGSIADSTSLNVFTYANGNPISFVDPWGLSADRGNNDMVFSDLEGLYNLAYGFYSNVNYDADRIKFANDAVMKYIIYNRFIENTSWKGKFAWEEIAGPVDYQFMYYMEKYPEYRNLQAANLYDPTSLEEIDFVHMIATLNSHISDRIGMGFVNDSLNTYAGWAGDLITLAGEIQKIYDKNSNEDIIKTVAECLSKSSDFSTFSKSDLLGDIDAVLIADGWSNVPIYQAIESYYQSDYKDRYNLFLEKEFMGSVMVAEQTAKNFLSPSPLTGLFKKQFQSSYSRKIIPDVAKGFAQYIGEMAG